MADEEKGKVELGASEYTKDGTVDFCGRPFLRAKGGGWDASSFILVSDALERVTYFGVASNLIIYLTNVLHQGTVTSASNVNYWMGTTMIVSIINAFIADSYLGRYSIRIFPIFVVTIMPSIMMAQVYTVFIKQGTILDPSLGPHFKIPPANLSATYTLSILVSIVIYDKLLMPFIRKHTNNPRGITILQRIGIGLVMHIITMLEASLVEKWRLSGNSSSPSTIFILLPQFVLMGIADIFAVVGKIEFFNDQAPESMKSMGTSLFILSNGIGSFISNFLLSTISNATRKGGREGWIQNNLNSSHLDYYYGLLASFNAINLIMFLIVSKSYVYKHDAANCTSEEKEKEGSK